MSVHGFLHRFFRESERCRAPRCVSAEAESRGTYDGALRAADWRIYSLIVMGRAEKHPSWTEEHGIALGAYYLHLAVDLVPVLEVEVLATLDEQGLPLPVNERDGETMGSMVSWRKLARMIFQSESLRRREQAKQLVTDGVAIVRWAIDEALVDSA